MTVKIRNLEPGESAVISGYETGNSYYRQKLLSMGLIKGTIITLLKTAPFGDPVQLELRGFKLSLRKTEADVLILEKDISEVEPERGFLNRMRRRFGFHYAHGKGGGGCGCHGCGRENSRGDEAGSFGPGYGGGFRKDSCCNNMKK